MRISQVNQSNLFVFCIGYFFLHFILVYAKYVLQKYEVSVLLLFADVIADGVAVLVEHLAKQALWNMEHTTVLMFLIM